MAWSARWKPAGAPDADLVSLGLAPGQLGAPADSPSLVVKPDVLAAAREYEFEFRLWHPAVPGRVSSAAVRVRTPAPPRNGRCTVSPPEVRFGWISWGTRPRGLFFGTLFVVDLVGFPWDAVAASWGGCGGIVG